MAMAEILPPTDSSYLNNQHPLVISFDPQSVAGEHDSPPSQHACFRRPCICKALADVGVVRGDVLFSSDRASKESACCFTAEAPQGIQTSGRQGLYLFLCQFVFLPSSWHPPLRPHLFLLPGPTQVILYLSHRSFQPTPPILLSVQNHSVWCLAARSCLSSMQSVSEVSQPVCTQSDHT